MASLGPLDEQLSILFSNLAREDALGAIETMSKLYQNIRDNPDEEQYRRVRIANKKFHRCVWSHPPAVQFLILCGWVEAGEFIVYVDDVEGTQPALESLTKYARTHQLETPPSQQQQQLSSTLQHKQTVNDKVAAKNEEEKAQLKKLLKDHQQRVAEEKKRIADQIKADRQETALKESKASQAIVRTYGGNINRFKDIGVDLNKGG